MKLGLLLALSFSLSQTGHAGCSPESSEFSGSFQLFDAKPINVLSKVILNKRSRRERRRVDELRKQGYICSNQPQNKIACSRNSSFELTGEQLKKINELYGNVSLNFGKKQGYKLLSKGESVTRWSVRQPVETSWGNFSDFQYLQLENLDKVKIHNQWLNVTNCEEIKMPITLAESNGRSSFQRFFVELILQ